MTRAGPTAAVGAWLLLAAVTHAQTPPSGGQLLKELTLPPPPQQTAAPNLSIEPLEPAHAGSDALIPVTHIDLNGNSLLSTTELHGLVAGSEGKTLRLRDLQELAGRITAHYRRRGYPLSRAYIPAQTIKDGRVTIAVLEARYGEIKVNNMSRTSDRPLGATLAPLERGGAVGEDDLDRSLLLLSDVPGISVNSTIRPGAATGTSDLQVDVTDAPRYSGLAALDNFGNLYTGRVRGTATFDVNSLFHQGDRLDTRVLTSGEGMSYGQLAYRYLLNGQGTTVEAAASYLHYRLTGTLAGLQAHGTAQVDSITLRQPFIRSTVGNLYGEFQFDHRTLHDDIDLAFIRTNRHINGWTAVLAGDRRDDRGVTNFSLTACFGVVTFDDETARLADALGPDTRGSNQHFEFTLARLQQLDRTNALYVAFTAQLASANLDPADQFYLGGPSNARGFDVGALTGAEGYLGTIEYRRVLPIPTGGVWLAGLFADRGHIQIYNNTFAPGPDDANLTDAGASLHWDGPHEWAVSMQYGARIGAVPELLHSQSRQHFWLQVQKGF